MQNGFPRVVFNSLLVTNFLSDFYHYITVTSSIKSPVGNHISFRSLPAGLKPSQARTKSTPFLPLLSIQFLSRSKASINITTLRTRFLMNTNQRKWRNINAHSNPPLKKKKKVFLSYIFNLPHDSLLKKWTQNLSANDFIHDSIMELKIAKNMKKIRLIFINRIHQRMSFS